MENSKYILSHNKSYLNLQLCLPLLSARPQKLMQLSVTYAKLNILLILLPGTRLEMCKNVWFQQESMGNHEDYKFDMCVVEQRNCQRSQIQIQIQIHLHVQMQIHLICDNSKGHNMASLYFLANFESKINLSNPMKTSSSAAIDKGQLQLTRQMIYESISLHILTYICVMSHPLAA